VDNEPSRKGEDATDCSACNAPDESYIWVSERWRVRAMDRPTGLPMVLILESRSHLDLGDLPNLLAAELGVMTVRLERAVRSLDGVARVHVNRWGDGSAHLHMWFLARPYGRLQLRGTFLSLWDDILPPISESTWRENLALVAAWLAEFGGKPLAEPPRIEWQAPSSLVQQAEAEAASLAQQAEADDTSVALVEAPADDESGDDETSDDETGKGTGQAAAQAAAQEATPDAAKPATAPAPAPSEDEPAPAQAEPAPAQAAADEDAATVDLARQGQPAPAVPAARSAEQSEARGGKPEHQRAAT
jgi:diadenosine tetraphosphate (Ap4A) HIT family hydrolase